MVKSSDKVNPEFKKERVNRYVYNDGKLIIISYPLYKGNNKLFYAAYEYKMTKYTISVVLTRKPMLSSINQTIKILKLNNKGDCYD